MIIVAHNLLAMNTQRQLGIKAKTNTKSTEKLSSGYKINRAADDAAGLAISEKMRKQIRGLEKGVENTMDGISLCRVVDGALAEVDEMLHRITELSVKAANGINSESDRQAIQEEINQLMQEINRVEESTKFNEIYPFKVGRDEIKYLENWDGSTAIESEIPFSDFKLPDINLGRTPFSQTSHADHLELQAVVDNASSVFHGKQYDMIFGDGSTSHSSFRLTYPTTSNLTTTDKMVKINMRDLTTEPNSYNYDAANNTWSRSFHYTSPDNDDGTNDNIDIRIKQIVKTSNVSDNEKQYEISYEFINNDPTTDVGVGFMFHADTAYNNNDQCEGYFINGSRIENNCVYANGNPAVVQGQTGEYIKTGVPDSFSVIDVDDALAFSEKISFSGTGNARPNMVSIGHYSVIDDWGYYTNLNNSLGGTTEREDLGFSLYYTDTIGNGTGNNTSAVFSFNYGIVATQTDQNLNKVDVKKDVEPVIVHQEHIDRDVLWIQSGAEAGDGMFLTLMEMNSEILGINGIDVTTQKGALEAIEVMDGALKRILTHRSITGAQQNRLEHTAANERNIIENTIAAESQIRDTDMAAEMVKYSNNNILVQAGQAMLAQANQSNQGVLYLLS